MFKMYDETIKHLEGHMSWHETVLVLVKVHILNLIIANEFFCMKIIINDELFCGKTA